jgi:hypothetical protein
MSLRRTVGSSAKPRFCAACRGTRATVLAPGSRHCPMAALEEPYTEGSRARKRSLSGGTALVTFSTDSPVTWLDPSRGLLPEPRRRLTTTRYWLRP